MKKNFILIENFMIKMFFFSKLLRWFLASFL